MVAIQSTYSQYLTAALPGNFATTTNLDDWVSKITDTVISFGFGVTRGAKDNSVKLPAATGFEFMGIVRRNLNVENSDNVETAASVAGKFSEIITNGYVFVICEDGCSPGDDVYLRHTVNGALDPGGFRTDADTANADQITSATWETTTAAGEVGIIKLRQGV